MSLASAKFQRTRLTQAFSVFNQTSETLSRAYQELQDRVQLLNEQLSASNDRLRQELRVKNELSHRLAVLIEALPGGVLVVDADDRISDANPAAQRLFGRNLVGCSWSELRDSEIKPTECPGEAQVAGDGGMRRISCASRVFDQQGAMVVLVNDITESHKAALRQQRSTRLAEMGKMSASLAHQLRTPLSTCLLYASSLGTRDLPPPEHEWCHARLMAQLRRLELLVRDMLSYVKGEVVVRARTGVSEVLSDVLHVIEPQAEQRGVALRVVNNAASAVVNCCRKSVCGALINLLENALQASGNGGHAEISISAGNGWLRIGVTDCGAGIEPDSRELVFEPFYTARPDGNGLGLSIVRNVVHAHDGSIEILSAAGCGSEFVVRLPLVAETAAAEEQHAC